MNNLCGKLICESCINWSKDNCNKQFAPCGVTEAQFKFHKKAIEKWKNNFSFPLTMKMACEILLDQSRRDIYGEVCCDTAMLIKGGYDD